MVDAIIQERSTKGRAAAEDQRVVSMFLSRAALEGDGEKTRRGERDRDMEICTEVVAPSPKKCYFLSLEHHCYHPFLHLAFVFPFFSSLCLSLSSLYFLFFS